MKLLKSSDIVSSELLVYDWSLMQSAIKVAMDKLTDSVIKRKIVRTSATAVPWLPIAAFAATAIATSAAPVLLTCRMPLQDVLSQLEQLEEAQREYIARMQASAAEAHEMPSEVLALNGDRVVQRHAEAPLADNAWPDRCAPAAPSIRQRPSVSPSTTCMHRMCACRQRRRQWAAPGARAEAEAMMRRQAPVDAGVHRRTDLSGEDDRLLLCLLTEFGESATLVAEVFSAIRRLDGVHMDRQVVVNRVRCRHACGQRGPRRRRPDGARACRTRSGRRCARRTRARCCGGPCRAVAPACSSTLRSSGPSRSAC
jgi:hypothetical protein